MSIALAAPVPEPVNQPSGWRTLAEPTYATSRFGRTVQFPAGTEVRITATNTLRVGAGTVAARAGFPFETEAAPRSHMASPSSGARAMMRPERAPEPGDDLPLLFRVTPPWLGVPDGAQFADEARRAAGWEPEDATRPVDVDDETAIDDLEAGLAEALRRLYAARLRRCG
jgi:hypothetical protein